MHKWTTATFFALATFSGAASAHTISPYILPDNFDIQTPSVSFQSAVTVEKFFVPNSNFKTSYVLTTPDGKTQNFNAAAELKRFNVAEIDTPIEGTYKIQTVNAIGNPARYALIDGRWLRVRPTLPSRPEGKNTINGQPRPTPPNQPPRFITADQIPNGTK
ncbi:MAG: DUF4198 domain-containing protein, partial [Acinetobacter sp.]